MERKRNLCGSEFTGAWSNSLNSFRNGYWFDIEYLNYSILLRNTGCLDEEIRDFLENMLTR